MKISANGLEISSGLLFAVERSLDTSNNGNFLQHQQYGVTFKCVNGSSKHYVCENWKLVCLCDRFWRYTFAECGNLEIPLQYCFSHDYVYVMFLAIDNNSHFHLCNTSKTILHLQIHFIK